MKTLNFPQIVYHELLRYFELGSRRQWAIMFSVFIQIVSLSSYAIAMKLTNYLSNHEILNTLSHFTLLIHIYSLPVFIIILSYDNFIRDPALQITAVVIVNRNKLYWTKLLSVSLFAFIIFLLNSTISFLILGVLLGESATFAIFLKAILLFLLICLFYTQLIIFIILAVKKYTLDDIATIILPVIIFYILPLIIHSSINFQILNINALSISPTLWAIFLMTQSIFSISFSIQAIFVPLTLIILIIPNIKLLNNHEFG